MTERVLGIDPGYDRCGVAVAERDERGVDVLLYSDCFTSPRGEDAERLHSISTQIQDVIATHAPQSVAIEKIFFSKNQKTAMKVAEARGVILAAAADAKIPVHEYSPQEIKLAITGHGASTKAQVATMIDKLATTRKDIQHDDEFDAIATALTHLATKKVLG